MNGKFGVTADIGKESQVKGVKGTLICLCLYDDENKPVKLVTGRIGYGGLKADTWYTLDADGKFVVVA